MDEAARRSVIRVIDKSSGILSVASNEDVLRAVRNIELLRGIIFEDNASSNSGRV